MVAPGKNHLKQKRFVSMALFLTQNLFVASGIELVHAETRRRGEGKTDSSKRIEFSSETLFLEEFFRSRRWAELG